MIRVKVMALAIFAYNILTVSPVTAATQAIVYSFGGGPQDGGYPQAGLIDVNGTLYGTTSYGGTNYGGTVFSVTPAGKENVLHSFAATETVVPGDGSDPDGPLLQVGDALYGTTGSGGAYLSGTVFKISAQGEQIVYSFGSRAGDGGDPSHGLIEVGGALYGTTAGGGSSDGGTVFKLTLSGQETILHSFGDCAPSLADGCFPYGRLLYANGALYGTTANGGFGQGGIVFRLNGTSETIVHSFGLGAGGRTPYGGLIDVDGVLYGTTIRGGRNPSGEPTYVGTMYSIDQSGREKLVYTFEKSPNSGGDGAYPIGELLNVNGILVGITALGGTHDAGTVYALLPDGSHERVLCNLHGGSYGSPIEVGDMLYGTTEEAGQNDFGTVFSVAH